MTPQKSFRTFLTEKKLQFGDAKWLERIQDHIAYSRIPLGTKMLARLFGGDVVRPVTCFHVAGFKNATRVVRQIQGTKKSLSVSPKVEPGMMYSGIHGGGGIILKLKGTLLASMKYDMMTRPDEDGMRWVEINSLVQAYAVTHFNGDEDLAETKLAPYGLKNFDEDFRSLSQQVSSVNRTVLYDMYNQKSISEAAGKKMLHNNIKVWFNEIEKLMSENIDLLRRLLYGIPPEEFTGGVSDSNWSEAVVNGTKVLEAGIIRATQSPGGQEFLDACTSKGIPVYRLTYGGHSVEGKLSDFMEFYYTGPVGSEEEMRKFVPVWYDLPKKTLQEFAKV